MTTTTNQIIVFTILGILWTIGYWLTAYSLKEDKSSFYKFSLFSVISIFFIIIAVTSTLSKNIEKRKSKDCPELQKLENVYTIKKQ